MRCVSCAIAPRSVYVYVEPESFLFEMTVCVMPNSYAEDEVKTCVAVRCCVVKSVVVRCSVLQCVGVAVRLNVMQCGAVRCSVLQRVAGCCSALQYVAVCRSVCCSVLQ